MRYDLQVSVEKGDVFDVRLPSQLLDLALNPDLILEVQDVIGVGVNGDDPRKAARAHGHAEGASFPKLCFFQLWRGLRWNFFPLFRQRPPSPPHEGHHPLSLAANLLGQLSPCLPHHLSHPFLYRGFVKFPRAPIPIKKLDLLEPVQGGQLA